MGMARTIWMQDQTIIDSTWQLLGGGQEHCEQRGSMISSPSNGEYGSAYIRNRESSLGRKAEIREAQDCLYNLWGPVQN